MEERKNRVIISVSRQFGSGGHKIAEALAECDSECAGSERIFRAGTVGVRN